MNRHFVESDAEVDDKQLGAALEAAGIAATVKPLHLQRLSKIAAAILSEYPSEERAHSTLNRWIYEEMDALDDARLKHINDSIDSLQRDYGELATWRSTGGYIALDLPTALVSSVARPRSPARKDIELRLLVGLMLPQLERIPAPIIKSALGVEFQGNQGDYQRLVELACRELMTPTSIEDDIAALVASPDTSHWLRESLQQALSRDCVDAANDAQVLSDLLSRRSAALLGKAADTF
jgi:hypothetical protein